MALNLHSIFPAAFPEARPDDGTGKQAGAIDRELAERISTVVAISLAVFAVGLIAVLMGMT